MYYCCREEYCVVGKCTVLYVSTTIYYHISTNQKTVLRSSSLHCLIVVCGQQECSFMKKNPYTFVWVFSSDDFSHTFSLFGLKSQCTFVWFFSSGEKTHAVFAWFWPLWLEKLIHLCMGFFIRHKNPCTFCMVLASLARKIHTPLHGFFRPAKKTMHFSHSFSLFG
jgi:hypothetical protein